jgi:hypothetical protein
VGSGAIISGLVDDNEIITVLLGRLTLMMRLILLALGTDSVNIVGLARTHVDIAEATAPTSNRVLSHVAITTCK